MDAIFGSMEGFGRNPVASQRSTEEERFLRWYFDRAYLFQKHRVIKIYHKCNFIALVSLRSSSLKLGLLLFGLNLSLSLCLHLYHVRTVFLRTLSKAKKNLPPCDDEGTQCNLPSRERICRDCPSSSTRITKKQKRAPYSPRNSSRTGSIFLRCRGIRNHLTYCLFVQKSNYRESTRFAVLQDHHQNEKAIKYRDSRSQFRPFYYSNFCTLF